MNLFNLIYGKNVWGLIQSTWNYISGWVLSPMQLLRWWLDTNAEWLGIATVIVLYLVYRYENKQGRESR